MAKEAQPAHYQLTHGAQSGHYQALTQVRVAHGVYPVQYHAMAQEAQPVQYQLTHGVQSGQYQAVTQVPVAHGTCPVQYNAMAQGAQSMPYQVMTQVPVSQGGQLHYMLVGGQGQLIDPVNQPQSLICFHQDSRGMLPLHRWYLHHRWTGAGQPLI
ncbi:hypothetical protein DPMN_183133 [Dreissena polymorpha]|uniref:Uncharacterized protein n=1 Tax=Dreissena polymorpha TaxID=45954 RepID=A0A9D4DJF6_DREPO|nr:hypothetical protein DPMN_183133 [Dreissena polymorpha]